MAYGSNILKNEAAYYSLQNATILDGILHLSAGGSATQQITTSDLPSITDTLQFTCIANTYSDRYVPNIKVLVHARLESSQKYYNAVLFPVQVEPNRYICEFKLAAGEYTEMYITLYSDIATDMSLWELCAIAADEDIETIIDGVKQSLPRLLYDYNTFPFDFDQCETTVAVITCRLLQNTDLQGHFLMTFLASQTATLTIRFYDNEAEELFAPLLYDVKVGYNSIGIPHAYMKRLAGIHTFIVTAQIAAGSCHIDTRKVLFTIDGGYLAVRELDIGMDVLDIAIRQIASSNGPDEIWCVGLDAGEVLVRSRNYTEKNASVGWTAIGSLGKGLGAAIEFDGDWVLRVSEHKATIDTEEEPWIFFITPKKKLYAYHGINDTEPILLDTNVVDVKACKGYSSTLYIEQDQGLVCLYRKNDGSVYYRRYYYNTASSRKLWEYAVEVPGTYSFANVHRLNDYRLSFELTSDTANIWRYTDRTYVGQAVYPEEHMLSGLNITEDHDSFVGLYSLDQLDNHIECISVDYEQHIADPDDDTDQDTVTFILTLNSALFGSQMRKTYWDRIVCTNVTDIINVEWEPNYLLNQTEIRITSSMVFRYIQYTFTIVPDQWLRYYYNGLLYPLTSNIVGVLDLREPVIVRDGTKHLTGITSASITYDGLRKRSVTVKDTKGLSGISSASITYSEIVHHKADFEETEVLDGLTVKQVLYYDIEDAPV